MSKDVEDDIASRKVGYIWSEEYEQVCDQLPSNIGRVSISKLPG